MNIINLEIHNFSSYYGTHKIDFQTDTNIEGFAIFGHEGRGKTSIMRAILWCLYGEVKSSVREGNKYLNRPLIDLSQLGEGRMEKIAPLISDQAVKRNKFDMYVTLKFESEGKTFILKRETDAKPNPRNDKDIKVLAHLSLNNSAVPPARIANVINSVIPERISRFFFIEMDAIERYADLLFGMENSLSPIKDDIEAILGFPAIEKSKEDFSELSVNYENKIRYLKRQGTISSELERDIKSCEEMIEEDVGDIKRLRTEIEELKTDIALKEKQLAEEPDAQILMKQEQDIKRDIRKCKQEIQQKYESRRKKLSGNTWLSLIQSRVESIINSQTEKRVTQTTLTREEGVIAVDIARAETRLEIKIDEDWFCDVCKEKRSGLNAKEKEILADDLAKLEQRKEDISIKLGELGNPQGIIDSLSVYRNNDSSTIEDIDTYEFEIGTKTVELSTLEGNLDVVEKELNDHDIKKIASLKQEIKSMSEYKGKRIGLLENLVLTHAENEKELKSLENKLKVSNVDKKKEMEYKLIQSTFDWLGNGFSKALSSARINAKRSVEKIANETFLETITESERYSKLTISNNWEIEVLSKDNKSRARLNNPGHKQIVAVSLFDGLRTTSKRKYPTFFDNPGSNISDKVLDKMVKHFWEQKNGQVIMLSHGGGLKEKESIENYGSSLAKAWRLNYVGDGLTSEIEEVSI
jgi:DNA sulfur modification protein DndD